VPPQFYNLRDQAIYSAGDFFIPQEKYRAAPYNVNKPAPDDPAAAGIPAIYQSQGGGGGGTYTGGITDLTGDFFKTISDRQNRLTELNRPLAEAQFPSFRESYGMATLPDGRVISNIENAQNLYNQTYGMDPNTVVAENFSYRGITDPTAGQINKMAADQIEDFREKYRTGQFGPSFIEAEKPTLNRRIQDAIYSLPFLSKPQSADQIIAEGYTGRSNMPGIMSMVLGSMDKYGELPRGDQAFIARNMGYTGPTVFGENTTGGAKDPFGLNVRSAFGNYAERVGKEVDKLGFALSDKGKTGGKYNATFNPATGLFEGPEAELANQMTKMMRAKLNFYQKQVAQRDADRAAAKAAEEAAAEAAAKRERDFADKGMSDPSDESRAGASGRRPGSGGAAIARDDQGDRGAGQTGGYSYDRGGREGFGYGLADGGIVDMLEIYD